MAVVKNDFAERTRKVYLEQHKQYFYDDAFFQRFLKMSSNPSYYHLTKKDFKGKNILDAGSGNSAYLEAALLSFGSAHVTCLDLGREWIKPLTDALTKLGYDKKAFSCVPGSTTKLPFENESFDMVFSNGVIMHLFDKKEINQAFKELARVTKKGGYLYVVLGCPGGLFEEEIFPAVRRYYRSNSGFKKFIDNLSPENFVDIFKFISQGMRQHTSEKPKFEPEKIKRMFDWDFCTWVQNVTQVPKRHIMELDEEFAFKMFEKYGFEKPKRCKRYVVRQNVRKFFAPMHFDSNNKFAKLFYGPGNLEFIARKK